MFLFIHLNLRLSMSGGASLSSSPAFNNNTYYTILCLLLINVLIPSLTKAQNETKLTSTPPSEVRALNLIFEQWNIRAESNEWNISGEPCSSLSPSIGNLTNMQYLSLGINALSGEVPKELGQLTELISLSFSSNNFSGPLPQELGNLSKLEQLYIDSCGINGTIPSTFANLQSLKTVKGSDIELTGEIPEFIGNWSNLTSLNFQGPIPSTLANLTSLTELLLSEISNGSSSLAFIANMKSLSVLVLRNISITGSIPSNIGEHKDLTQLDLSFNKLNGQIPNSLFNLSSLNALFLGNNNLNGTLPQRKSASLLTIDVTYNNLVGSIPSWVNNQQNLDINLVGNNFTIDNSNNRTLLTRLNCLQKNFPCNRDHYNFGINSGGNEIRSSSDNLVYEKDDEALSPAAHFVTSSERWGVSNVGLFAGNSNATYTSNSLSQFQNTLDPELYQTTRLSASSLRYYGLGLQNGNYTVKLQFVETAFDYPSSWKSLGRRMFDIFIQGKLEIKDFDIRKEAGAVSLRAVQKEFKARVSENYLEIHLYWAGRGTCCIPAQGTYGPSISAISATPVAFYVVQRRKKSQMNDDEEFLGMDVKPFTFGYAELRTATNDFDSSNNGYLAPEYAMRGHLTEKTDVYAFGVVALEIVSGRPNSDSSLARPSMSRVVAMLSGDTDVSTEVSRPGYLVDWKFNDVSTLMSQIEQGTTDPTLYDSCSSTSIVADAMPSQREKQTHPMLQDN
ncbi:hypothetical protein F8388_007491, partial [Cannabis sativa]